MRIQAKETIRVGDPAWNKLWKDFLAQYKRTDFKTGVDRLVFQIGERQPELVVLRELCNRAVANADINAYKDRLTLEQKLLLEKIRSILPIDSLTDLDFVQFLSRIRVEFWDLSYIEKPEVNQDQKNILA